MTDIRTTEISGLFERWLERYSPPAQIRENERAQQDEARALLGVLLRFAPSSGYADFIATALDRLEYQMKTRAWPSKGEIGAVCSNLRKEGRQVAVDMTGEAVDMTDAAVAARRMRAGAPVGEFALWGSLAVEIAARGLIDADIMRQYRSGAFFARKAASDEAAALAWEAERKAAHEAAKAVWRDREEPQSRDVSIRTRSGIPQGFVA